jgi:hypothetical protein
LPRLIVRHSAEVQCPTPDSIRSTGKARRSSRFSGFRNGTIHRPTQQRSISIVDAPASPDIIPARPIIQVRGSSRCDELAFHQNISSLPAAIEVDEAPSIYSCKTSTSDEKAFGMNRDWEETVQADEKQGSPYQGNTHRAINPKKSRGGQPYARPQTSEIDKHAQMRMRNTVSARKYVIARRLTSG